MSKTITIATLCKHIDHAKERLSEEKAAILILFSLPKNFNREKYAFDYLRAERIGMRVINHKLADVDWLPMQLDTSCETIRDGRSALTRWLKTPETQKPSSEEFGNDFMHALTRVGFLRGWDDGEFDELADRIALLFRDLSCLISIIYYCTWLTEHGIEEIRLHDPSDLILIAEDIDSILQSPELYQKLRAAEQDEGKSSRGKSKGAGKGGSTKALPPPKKQGRPALRIIVDHDIMNPFVPDPATA